MSGPTISNELAQSRPPTSRSAASRFGRISGFTLGLFLGSLPLLTEYLAPIYINITANRNGSYHGDYVIIGLVLLSRIIGDVLVILFIMLTPVLAHFKKTRPASYGLISGLALSIAFPVLTYLLVSLYSVIHPSYYVAPFPSNMRAWFSLLEEILPIIGLIFIPILARTPRTRRLSFVLAIIIALVFFYQSPIHYYF